MPLFSIIIPTYNSEELLPRALRSISEQDYRDYEVLIMDGESNDLTISIAENFKSSLASIEIWSEQDKGIYDAMNKGLYKARGDYIYFMGSDDCLYANNVLSHVSRRLAQTELDVLYGDVFSSRFGGRYDGPFDLEKLGRRNICHQAIFVHRKVFTAIGDFSLRFKAHADWHHNLKWFTDPRIRVAYIDLVIANYSDGGYSSRIIADTAFQKRKNYILLWRGRGALSTRGKIHALERIKQGEGYNNWLEKFLAKLVIKMIRTSQKLTHKL